MSQERRSSDRSSPGSQVRAQSKSAGLPRQWGLLALVVALAVGVRCFTLSFQSLWLDEISTVVEAARPWSSLLADLFRPYQAYPLYILTMRGWGALFNPTEVALRLPSAVAGVCTVVLLYTLGRRLFGQKVGLLAAVFLALSPLGVWYSQEATTYALATFLTLAAWLLLWEAIERPTRAIWWALGGVTLLALSIHRLLAVLSLVGQLAYLLVVARQGRFPLRHRRLLTGLLLAVLVASLVGVWFWFEHSGARRQFGTQRDVEDLVNTFTQFSLRVHPGPPQPGQGPDRRPCLLAFEGAAVAGLASLASDLLARGRRRRRAAYLLSALVAPVGSFFLLYLVSPFYHERYLLCALPAYLLLLAVGVSALWRWAAGLARSGRSLLSLPLGAMALAAAVISLTTSWQQIQDWSLSRRPSREQFREATRHLQEHLHPGDLVVVHPGYIASAVEHYQGSFPRVPLELHTVRALYTKDYDYRDFGARMDDLARGRRRAWLYLAPYHSGTQDPNNWVYEWFYLNPFLHCGERSFNGLELYCISFNQAYREPVFPTPTNPLEATFSEMLLLSGADLEPFQRPLQPGDSLPITLYAEGLLEGLPDLEVVVRLSGPDGHVWREVARRPLDGDLPTTRWEPGDAFLDYHELLIPEGAPSGVYGLAVAYRLAADRSAWLLLPGGDVWADLGVVEVDAEGGE